MSLTVIALVVMVSAIIIGVGAMFAGYDNSGMGRIAVPAKIVGLLMAPLAVAALVVSIASYNTNVRESKESCIARGRIVYSASQFEACFAERPVELQKL